MEKGDNDMQDIKVIINGKEQTLTAEQIESISKMFPRDEWARKAKGETYWVINNDGEQTRLIDSGDIYDVAYYSVGNYYPTEHIAEMRALDWQLNNLLFRYSMKHDGEKISSPYMVFFDVKRHKWCIACTHSHRYLNVYFVNFDVAEAAIHDVVEPFCREHPEYLEWLRGEKR